MLLPDGYVLLLGWRPVILYPGETGCFQVFFQQFEHRSKLGKYQHFVAAFSCACDQLHAGFPLGRTAVVVFKTKGRVAADLAYPCKFSQYFSLFLLKSLRSGFSAVSAYAPAGRCTDPAAFFSRFCVAYFFQFFRRSRRLFFLGGAG